MLSRRLFITLTICCTIVAAQHVPETMDQDYLDDIKEFAHHQQGDAVHKYMEQLNKMDMLEDYPTDEDEADEEDYDDEDEEDEDEDDDDDEEGGCGGGDDDDDDDDDEDDDEDEDEEELSPVEEVIEEFFTR